MGQFSILTNGSSSSSTGTSSSISCHDCPIGSECLIAGVTFATLNASVGYWRSSADSLDFLYCLRTAHCIGGPGGGSQLCSENREGPLCAICAPNYHSSSIDNPCTACPSRSQSTGLGILFTGLILLAIAVLCWAAFRSDESWAMTTASLKLSTSFGSLDPEHAASGGIPPAAGSSSAFIARASAVDSAEATSEAQRKRISASSAGVDGTMEIVLVRETRVPASLTFTFKITLGFLQVASTLAAGIEVPWPSYFRSFITVALHCLHLPIAAAWLTGGYSLDVGVGVGWLAGLQFYQF